MTELNAYISATKIGEKGKTIMLNSEDVKKYKLNNSGIKRMRGDTSFLKEVLGLNKKNVDLDGYDIEILFYSPYGRFGDWGSKEVKVKHVENNSCIIDF